MGEVINLFGMEQGTHEQGLSNAIDHKGGASAQLLDFRTKEIKGALPATSMQKDVSNESYYFTFNKTEFYFGGGAFTRDLLERLEVKREAIINMTQMDTELQLADLESYKMDSTSKGLFETMLRGQGESVVTILQALKTPNDLNALMEAEATRAFMPLVLASILYACYVPFDLMRMVKQNWCSLDSDPTEFIEGLEAFFDFGDVLNN